MSSDVRGNVLLHYTAVERAATTTSITVPAVHRDIIESHLHQSRAIRNMPGLYYTVIGWVRPHDGIFSAIVDAVIDEM